MNIFSTLRDVDYIHIFVHLLFILQFILATFVPKRLRIKEYGKIDWLYFLIFLGNLFVIGLHIYSGRLNF